MAYFNEKQWDECIQEPDWYMGTLWDEYSALKQLAEEDELQRDSIKRAVRGYFVDRISRNLISFEAEPPINLDYERQPIDTVVIHHTSGAAEDYTLDYLNVVHMLQIYAPYFRKPTSEEAILKGTPLASGHYYKGKQVFWGYHWFISENGSAERLLPDSAIGWQAGNWNINKRSVAICFAGNFMKSAPNEHMQHAAHSIIQEHYKGLNIIGHREVNQKTSCPGDTFSVWRGSLQR